MEVQAQVIRDGGDSWAVFEDEWESSGFTQVPNCVMRDGSLSMEAKYLYGLLKSYAWEDPDCHPGVDRLCKNAGVSAPTLGKYMKELDGTLITVVRRGQGKTNRYIFLSLAARYKDSGASEVKGALDQDQKPPLPKEYPGEEDSTTPLSGEPQAPAPGDFVAYLRDKLRGSKPPLTREREGRYAKQFKEHLKRGVQPETMQRICDRIVDRWTAEEEHYKLTVEQAAEDVANGKVTGGFKKTFRREGTDARSKEDQAARRKEGYEWLFAD